MDETEKIVPFVLADLDEVMAIEDASFTLPWSRQAYLDLYILPTVSFYVARHGEKVVGYMLYQTWQDETDLHTIAVDPKVRRKGVAARMIEHMIKETFARNVKNIFLQVRPSNDSARALYYKFGFIAVGIRKRYYQDNGEDALLMQLTLRDVK